jgi:hypothetical protein
MAIINFATGKYVNEVWQKSHATIEVRLNSNLSHLTRSMKSQDIPARKKRDHGSDPLQTA